MQKEGKLSYFESMYATSIDLHLKNEMSDRIDCFLQLLVFLKACHSLYATRHFRLMPN